MIARHTGCPVIVDPDRVAGVQKLENEFDINVIISDDGMQHYRLNRTMEIAIVDGQRGFGNGYLLPAGPLREKPARLSAVDLVVCNGATRHDLPESALRMDLEATHLVHLADNRSLSVHDAFLSSLTARKVHAVAGIGNPERFFNSLCSCGFDIITHIYRDHHLYREQDITFADDLDVVMTEKDAVKCRQICSENHWFLKVTARLPEAFIERVLDKLQTAALPETKHRCVPGLIMDKKLLTILACPLCKGELVYNQQAQELICYPDSLAYPIRDDIPIMLEDEARALTPEEKANRKKK